MTDYPRFQMARGEPDECHRHYHGAPLVEWVLRAADWWLKRRMPWKSSWLASLKRPSAEAAPRMEADQVRSRDGTAAYFYPRSGSRTNCGGRPAVTPPVL
jgi:hypothetical protein